ncbi:hypothetical protein AB7C87_20280 [Natrarchaeobius sp. A-rgal3]|uniref:hypothetical protein n=1 Tax=Natrarchaeobius versutus TaxID=1679078 RepID=UPI00350EE35F
MAPENQDNDGYESGYGYTYADGYTDIQPAADSDEIPTELADFGDGAMIVGDAERAVLVTDEDVVDLDSGVEDLFEEMLADQPDEGIAIAIREKERTRLLEHLEEE